MAQRRSLKEGLKAELDPKEEAFVYGTSPPPAPAEAEPEPEQTAPLLGIARVPFTTRIRADIAQALKRATLKRKLDGIEPNTVQEILETTLEPWLREKGYLK